MEQDTRTQYRILVVDNDERLLSTIEDYLQLCGYQVTTASTGLDALRHLRSETYHVLVTDIVMPDISGLGLIQICQKEFPGLRLIAMTGYAKQVKSLTIEKEPDYYLEKPFKLTVLIEALDIILSKEKDGHGRL